MEASASFAPQRVLDLSLSSHPSLLSSSSSKPCNLKHHLPQQLPPGAPGMGPQTLSSQTPPFSHHSVDSQSCLLAACLIHHLSLITSSLLCHDIFACTPTPTCFSLILTPFPPQSTLGLGPPLSPGHNPQQTGLFRVVLTTPTAAKPDGFPHWIHFSHPRPFTPFPQGNLFLHLNPTRPLLSQVSEDSKVEQLASSIGRDPSRRFWVTSYLFSFSSLWLSQISSGLYIRR